MFYSVTARQNRKHLLSLLVPEVANEDVLDQTRKVLSNPLARDVLYALLVTNNTNMDLVSRCDDVDVIIPVQLCQCLKRALHYRDLARNRRERVLHSQSTDS